MITRILVCLSLIVFSTPAFAQEVESSKAGEPQAESQAESPIAANLKTVKLEKRIDTEYGKSGFSFRYKTQDSGRHNNYVDVVYESGMMRINNHGGLESRIADLGTEKDIEKAIELVKSAKWSDKLVPPVAGRTYALEIKEYNHKMTALFHVSKVDDKVMEFIWQPDQARQWPIHVKSRGVAGCSGMMVGLVPR